MSDRHQTKPYPLRIGDALRSRLEDAAKGSGRSLNAEIVQRLEASFSEQVGSDGHLLLADDQIEAFADAIYARMVRQGPAADVDPGASPVEIVINNRKAEISMLATHIEEVVKECHLAEMTSGPKSVHYRERQAYLKYLRNLHDELHSEAGVLEWREQERTKLPEPSQAKHAKGK